MQYEWIDQWATLPDNPTAKDNGRTHGIVMTRDDNVMVFCQADPAVLIFNPKGKLIGSWGDRFAGAHGMTLVEEEGIEYLWLTDPSSKEVCKTTLDGQTVQTIAQAPHSAYEEGNYAPTWVAVNPDNGDIWVADGYGSSLIHRYNKDGEYISSLTGEEGAGRFKCPHGIMFDEETELWIADRGNHRIAVYDSEGELILHNDEVTHSPCGFSFDDELAYVPELHTGVKVIDRDLKLVAEVGTNPGIADVEGWPNLASTEHVIPGRFNSPHGCAAAPTGDIYVTEWIVGGRITKLALK